MGKKVKLSQLIMVWFLPLIIVGGLFFPLLGYLVLLMMIFLLSLSYFKGRFWCSHLCPRGAFLDLALSRVSRKAQLPRIFASQKFRWGVFAIFMIFFASQLFVVERNVYSLGFVFVRMCLVTTLIAIFIGIPFQARTWCAVCPMGTLQTKIRLLNRRK
ncbi:MAG: 4Fe-4S binding protein [Candidatus Omnitrophica bacterium]|nr:4Fe-4S binding protein [Candidatus Omnitrophota bacterium]